MRHISQEAEWGRDRIPSYDHVVTKPPPPPWGLSYDQVVISGVWVYVMYTLFCDGRARDGPHFGDEFVVTARASLRSLCTRVPMARRALYSDAVGLYRLPCRRWHRRECLGCFECASHGGLRQRLRPMRRQLAAEAFPGSLTLRVPYLVCPFVVFPEPKKQKMWATACRRHSAGMFP